MVFVFIIVTICNKASPSNQSKIRKVYTVYDIRYMSRCLIGTFNDSIMPQYFGSFEFLSRMLKNLYETI